MLRNGKKYAKNIYINATEDEEVEESDNELIKVIDNNIYFYCDVSSKSALKLNTTLKQLEIDLLTLSIKYNSDPYPINLHINSEGGEIYAALSIVDTIINSRVKVISIIEGIACSAATLISVVCHNRIIYQNAQMMIHQLSCQGLWGKMNELEDEMKNMKSDMNAIKQIYNNHTKINFEELPKILKKDINWSSKKCKKYGLVDEIK